MRTHSTYTRHIFLYKVHFLIDMVSGAYPCEQTIELGVMVSSRARGQDTSNLVCICPILVFT